MRELNAKKILATIDVLGENVTTDWKTVVRLLDEAVQRELSSRRIRFQIDIEREIETPSGL